MRPDNRAIFMRTNYRKIHAKSKFSERSTGVRRLPVPHSGL